MKIISFVRFKGCAKFEICLKEGSSIDDERIMRILFKLSLYYPCEPVEM